MKAHFSTYWRQVASGRSMDFLSRMLVALLLPASLCYSLLQRLRALLYKTGIFSTVNLPRPVISIGNISVGGTGKTPVTAYVARLLLEQNLRVAVLSRGYGGSLEGETVLVSDGNTVMLTAQECGDEPFLLAATIPGLIVVIGTDRYAAGALAMKQLSPDVFLLDDGFQHLRLQRDLNILLVDYAHPFGNGWTLPAGLLREPKSAASRADLVIHTRCPEVTNVRYPLPGKTNIAAHHLLHNLVPFRGGSEIALHKLGEKRVLAFAAIAEPHTFFDALQSDGLQLIKSIPFPDHSYYTELRVKEIMAAVRSNNIDCVITTAKDAVKLDGISNELAEIIYIATLEISLTDADELQEKVINLLQK